MAKDNKILAIDIGGDSLKMAEFSFPPNGGILLERFAVRFYEEQSGSLEELFRSVYFSMLRDYSFSAKRVRLAISGQYSFSRLSKLPPMMENNHASVARIVEFEARQTVPYPMDEVVWDYQLVHHSVPIGEDESMGTIDEFEALFIAMKADMVSAITDMVEESGKEIESVEVSPTATFNTAMALGLGDNSCDMVLNIGGRSSSLIFLDRGRLFMRSIPIAGNSITSQIAKEFGISFEEAEEMKRRHGFVALDSNYELDSQVAETIAKIVRSVLMRLHGEINRSINVWRSQHSGARPERLFIAGGGSMMPYMVEFFSEKLHMDVDYLNSFRLINFSSNIDKDALSTVAPMFGELIGMALREKTDTPVDISLMPKSVKAQEALEKRKPYLYASVAALIICVLMVWAVAVSLGNFEAGRAAAHKAEVNAALAAAREVNQVDASVIATKEKYEEALNFADRRYDWINIFDELQANLPPTMWMAKISLYGDGGGSDFFRSTSREQRPWWEGGIQGELDEVAGIRVTAYALAPDNNKTVVEEIFRNNMLANSKYFDFSEDNIFESASKDKNLTRLEIRLKLKEPVRK